MSDRAGTLDDQVRASARTIAEVSSHVYEVVRGMMRRLRPAILDELGLVPALEDMVDDWNSHHGDQFCSLSCDANLGAPPALQISIYRIVQECLTNVAKHARASKVEVSLQHARTADGSGCLDLRVCDDGRGYAAEVPPPGLGWRGIRERVDAVRGALEISGAPGKGVTVHVRMPLAAVEEQPWAAPTEP
jgi:signal transduction histidine kinase